MNIIFGLMIWDCYIDTNLSGKCEWISYMASFRNEPWL